MTDTTRTNEGARRSAAAGAGADDRTIGQIIGDITQDFRELLRDELALAKAEFNQALKKIVMGMVLLAIGASLATTGLTALVAAAILGLTVVWSPWVSALVVGLAIIVIGGILAIVGIQNFSAAQLMPNRTVETLQEDARAVREGAR